MNSYREEAERFLSPLVDLFSSFEPNTLTMLSLIFAFAAGLLFYEGSWGAMVLGGLFVLLNGLLDAVDGEVARRKARASRRGDFLDHLVDRYADIAILAGLTLGPWCRDWLGVLALTGVFLTSYVGTQAQAVGVGRDYGGLLGRADRMVFLIVVPILQGLLAFFGIGRFFALSPVEAMMIWFALAGHLTAVLRARRAWERIW